MDNHHLFDILGRASQLSPSLPKSAVTPTPLLLAPGTLPSAPLPPQSQISQRQSKLLPAKAGKTVTKPTKKRTWKKPADKPKRPLSAYNLFFQSEREKIVAAKDAEARTAPIASAAAAGANKVEHPTIRTAGANDGTKRRHRRTHGKIGFAALAQNIAAKWKVLDDASKVPFVKEAAKEKLRYKKEIEIWDRAQKIKKVAEAEELKDKTAEKKQEQQKQHKPQQHKLQPRKPKSLLEPPPAMLMVVPSNDQAVPHVPERTPSSSITNKIKFLDALDFEPISIATMNAMTVPQPPKAMVANAPMSLESMLAPAPIVTPSTSFLPQYVPSSTSAQSLTSAPSVCVSARDTQLDTFDMNINPVVGDTLPCDELPFTVDNSSVEDVMSSIDKIDSALDEEFVDFMSTFDVVQ